MGLPAKREREPRHKRVTTSEVSAVSGAAIPSEMTTKAANDKRLRYRKGAVFSFDSLLRRNDRSRLLDDRDIGAGGFVGPGCDFERHSPSFLSLYYGWFIAISMTFLFMIFSLSYARYRHALPIIFAHEVIDLVALIRFW